MAGEPMSDWETRLQQRLDTDREYAKARHCDDTKAEARLAYVGHLFDTYRELSIKAEDYSWNESYVNVRVWVLAEMLEILAANEQILE